MLECDLRAERTDVDEVVAVRREADCPLPGEERALAHRANMLDGLTRQLSWHNADPSPRGALCSC